MIFGMDTIERRLNGLSEKLRANALAEGAQAGGEVIARSARARAPRLSGRLAEKGVIAEIVERAGTKGVAGVGLTKAEFYGLIVEKGSKFARAKPFLRPAFDEQKDAAVREVERKLREVVMREVRR